MNFSKHLFITAIIAAQVVQNITPSLWAQSPAAPTDSPKQHTIVIKQWELAKKKGDVLFIAEYDGKLLHPNDMAIDELNHLKFEVNSVIKVVLPLEAMTADNFLRKASFLRHAFEDGASVVFYRGDKKMNYHVLLFESIRVGPTSEEKELHGGWNTDTATFVLNGKKFFDGPSTVFEMKKLSYEDKMVFVLYPGGFNPQDYNFGLVDRSEIDRYVKSLKLKGVEFVAVGCDGSNGWPVPIIGQ